MNSNRGLVARLSHSGAVIVIYGVLLAMLAILAIINHTFFSLISVQNLFNAALPLVFAAMAETVVILAKGIDLSVGPAMSLTMVVAASLMQDSALSIIATVLVCVLLGLLIGAANGILVVGARLPPIIVTLATSSILTGCALFVMPQPGGHIPSALGTFATGVYGPVPMPALILLVIVVFLWIPVRFSHLGQGWYAVGGNELGAYYSGLKVSALKFSSFVAGGVLASFGGIFLAAHTLTGDPTMGTPYTLNAIAATVLGGTSLAGGRGGVLGAIGGAFVLTVIVDILFYFGVSAYYQYVFSGAIVILALAVGTLSEVLRNRDRLAV